MLALMRQEGESILIGDDIRVKVVAITSHKVKLAIDAPQNLPIDREEVRLSKIETGNYIPTHPQQKGQA